MIQVKNLNFTYPKTAKRTLKDLNFYIKEGEIFGFLGPNGAGKSTTQKILTGLLIDYQGEISVMGRDLRAWKSNYYEHIGVGFEIPNHYLKLTALENLTYFRSLYSGETEEPQTLLEMVGLGNEGNLRVSQFSKGMKVRLGFARALLHKPELIFLDEPTTGLDPVNARLIKDLILQKRAEGKTIFLTTHNMTVADQLCNRVAFIVEGEIKLIDSPRNLKLQYGKRLVRVEYRLNGHVTQQEFPLSGLGDNADFLQLLRQHEIQTIHTQETTMENIFIEVTGRRLS
jgi:fluoroquinolone transport system ATP-binding protein